MQDKNCNQTEFSIYEICMLLFRSAKQSDIVLVLTPVREKV